jgi:hypothetical protein
MHFKIGHVNGSLKCTPILEDKWHSPPSMPMRKVISTNVILRVHLKHFIMEHANGP